MIKVLAFTAIAALIAAFVLAIWTLFAPPVRAAECRSVTADRVFADIAEMDGQVIGTVPYPGTSSDTAVFFTASGTVFMVLLNGECYQSGPLAIDSVPPPKPTGTPA